MSLLLLFGGEAVAVEHATSGALSGPGAAIVGAASSATARPSSGALTGQGAVVAGAASRTRQHAAEGILAGQGAEIIGAAARSGYIGVAASSAHTFRPGYIAPRRKKKRDEPPAVVEIAVERQEIKYVAVRQQTVIGPSVAPIMAAVEEVTRLIEARARNAEIRAKIEELEEEEDIIIILSQLQ